MSRDARVAMLLDRWARSAERGERLSAEELCRDCPELVELVRLEIPQLQDIGAGYGKEYTVADDPRTAGDLDTQDLQLSSKPLSSRVELLSENNAEDESDRVLLLGHYRTLERLGSGGFGTVWKAHDTTLDRIVAIKIPKPERMCDGDVARFLREGKAAAQLNHPHIVSVYDVASQENVPYIVSEFIDGVPLDEWIKHRRLHPIDAARVCLTLAEAMQHAHDLGIIHRDLKPSNVVMDSAGKPHVMDFGLAKRIADDITVTTDGAILGTPAYMAPEQARGEGHDADARTDIYSLGVLLFETLTGERPFRGSLSMIVRQVLEDEPPRPRKLNSSIPRDLETICLRCLEKERGRRYQTAGELGDDLQRFLLGKEIKARPIGRLGRIWRWYRANSSAAVATAGGYSILSGCILLGWGTIGIGHYALGMHPSENPERAVLELLVLCMVVYPLFISVGVATLNGRILALWLSAIWWLAWSILTVSSMLGIFPTIVELEVVAAARSNAYIRQQLFSLLSVFTLFGLATHAAAIFLHYAIQPHPSPLGSKTPPQGRPGAPGAHR